MADDKSRTTESDGHIDMYNSTIGEVKERIKSSPYSTNRAIMRAALKIKEANGLLPDNTPMTIAFTLNGVHHARPDKFRKRPHNPEEKCD